MEETKVNVSGSRQVLKELGSNDMVSETVKFKLALHYFGGFRGFFPLDELQVSSWFQSIRLKRWLKFLETKANSRNISSINQECFAVFHLSVLSRVCALQICIPQKSFAFLVICEIFY